MLLKLYLAPNLYSLKKRKRNYRQARNTVQSSPKYVYYEKKNTVPHVITKEKRPRKMPWITTVDHRTTLWDHHRQFLGPVYGRCHCNGEQYVPCAPELSAGDPHVVCIVAG